jgi:hypothetical protein
MLLSWPQQCNAADALQQHHPVASLGVWRGEEQQHSSSGGNSDEGLHSRGAATAQSPPSTLTCTRRDSCRTRAAVPIVPGWSGALSSWGPMWRACAARRTQRRTVSAAPTPRPGAAHASRAAMPTMQSHAGRLWVVWHSPGAGTPCHTHPAARRRQRGHHRHEVFARPACGEVLQQVAGPLNKNLLCRCRQQNRREGQKRQLAGERDRFEHLSVVPAAAG